MDRTSRAVELMDAFAERTGLTSHSPPRRYLWTDAFAVTNLLGLAQKTGEARHEALALRLVDVVHRILGRHRADDPRSGWISGLSDADATEHPTACGLRIGKPLPEREAGEPYTSDLEWERDGQYFHYLTKWMHALDQVSRRTGRAEPARWARELAIVTHDAFAYGPPANRRMVWKLSVDLSRVLVPSMGQHDPLDGFVTCVQLGRAALDFGEVPDVRLSAARSDYAGMVDHAPSLVTDDPLGIGGLFVEAARLHQLSVRPDLVASLVGAATIGIGHWLEGADLHAPAEHRLAFRELGLAIGLAAASLLDGLGDRADLLALREEIESFWLDPRHRDSATWRSHADINDVMLATALEPRGFLVLPRLPARVIEAAAEGGR